jgi:hypothetical protein
MTASPVAGIAGVGRLIADCARLNSAAVAAARRAA